MIKRILAIIISLALCMAVTVAFAESEYDTIKNVSIAYDAETQSISVSGEVDSEKANGTVIFRMMKVTGEEEFETIEDVLVDFTSTRKTAKGVTFDFGAIRLSDDFESNDYSGYYFRNWWEYDDGWGTTASYIDDLKAVAAYEGINPTEVDMFLEDGFTPAEIENYIYCM